MERKREWKGEADIEWIFFDEGMIGRGKKRDREGKREKEEKRGRKIAKGRVKSKKKKERKRIILNIFSPRVFSVSLITLLLSVSVR